MHDQTTRPTEVSSHIRSAIREAERSLLQRHSWLGWTDFWAATLSLISITGMILLVWCYFRGLIPWWICLLGNAFLASLLHEVEHDLIHYLYFKDRPWVQNLLMFLVWSCRGNIIHGWARRPIHFQHHRVSGRPDDIEERLLGLGLPWGLRRFLIMMDGAMAYFLCGPLLEKEIPGFRRSSLFWASLPFYPLFVLLPLCWGGLEIAIRGPWQGLVPVWLLGWLPWISAACVGWVFPNYLRQASLQIVSSNVHYYEDVHGVDQETQILRPFFLWPLQLFCFNFGSTHTLHHYVANQPFYLRQLIAPRVYPVLRKYGVRFNDLGTFQRANRYQEI